ncbi:MAG: epimerase [Promethearchaeota archaeon]|nr:MAG: epimerase [Candidatus Lokiarchaeota archaeon]
MDQSELRDLFKDFDAMVYAVGPDDRITPEAPAFEFFHERLVEACSRVVQAAKDAGVKKTVICNSYFAYFDRTRPELKLKEKHAYIQCRVEQAQRCIEIGGDEMIVIILEFPYIFGTHPVREPIWKDLIIKRIQDWNKYVYFFHGGSNMITVEHIAESIVGALENGRESKRYPIGDENVTWERWLKIILDEMGTDKKILFLPPWAGKLYGSFLRWQEKREGKEAGLDYRTLFKDIQSREFFFDPTPSQEELGYSGGGVEESIRKTVQRCLEGDGE